MIGTKTATFEIERDYSESLLPTPLTEHTEDNLTFEGIAGISTGHVDAFASILNGQVFLNRTNARRAYTINGTYGDCSDIEAELHVLSMNTYPYHSVEIGVRKSAPNYGYRAFFSNYNGKIYLFGRADVMFSEGVVDHGLTAGTGRTIRLWAEDLLTGAGSPPAEADCVRLHLLVNGVEVLTYDDTHADRHLTGPATIGLDCGGSDSGSIANGTVFTGLTLTYTGDSATAYTMTNSGSTVIAGYPHRVTIEPNALADDTITVSPSGAGLTGADAVVLTFDANDTPQTVDFLPTETGVLTISATNSGALTDPANLTPTIVGSPAWCIPAPEEYSGRRFTGAEKVTFWADHPSGIVALRFSFDNWATTFDTVTEETLNTTRANTGDVGVRSLGSKGYVLEFSSDDFETSGLKNIYVKSDNGDGTETDFGVKHIVDCDKEGATLLGYMSGAGSDENSGLTALLPKATFSGATLIHGTTNHVRVMVGAGDYLLERTESPPDNTTFFEFERDPAVPMDEAIVSTNGANTKVPGPAKTIYRGFQFGTGDPDIVWPYFADPDPDNSTAHIFIDCLHQGPLSGHLWETYHGMNYIANGNDMNFGDCSYINCDFFNQGVVKSAWAAANCRTRWGIWGFKIYGGGMSNCQFETIILPPNEDRIPPLAPGDGVHPDIVFMFDGGSGLYTQTFYMRFCRAVIGPGLARGFVLNGDGSIPQYTVITHCGLGSIMFALGNGGLSVGSDVVVLRNMSFTGQFSFDGTGNPLRAHNCICRHVPGGVAQEPSRFMMTGSYETWDEEGAWMNFTCWDDRIGFDDNELTAELAIAPDATIEIEDVAGFTVTDSFETITITGITNAKRCFRFTKTGTIYAYERPKLNIAIGAIRINGVLNTIPVVLEMEYIDNYSIYESPITASVELVGNRWEMTASGFVVDTAISGNFGDGVSSVTQGSFTDTAEIPEA
jgi:hypothetical protein